MITVPTCASTAISVTPGTLRRGSERLSAWRSVSYGFKRKPRRTRQISQGEHEARETDGIKPEKCQPRGDYWDDRIESNHDPGESGCPDILADPQRLHHYHHGSSPDDECR